MRLRKNVITALGLVAAAACSISTCRADGSTLTSSLSLSRFDASTLTQVDILLGHGSAGPYSLSWHGIREGGEMLTKNGVTLLPDTDYRLDGTRGEILFVTPLASSDIVRVSYRCDTPGAAPSPAVVSPVSWDIWQSGHTSVSLATLPAASAGAQGTSDSIPVFQFQTSSRIGKFSNIHSSIHLDGRGGALWDRGSFDLGEETKSPFAGAAINFTHSGSDSVSPTGSAGTDALDASGRLQLARGLNVLAEARAESDHSKPGEHGSTSSLNGSLDYAFSGGGQVKAGSVTTESRLADGSTSSQTIDTATVRHSLAPGTSAAVTFDSATVTASGGATAVTQKTSVVLDSHPGDRLTVSGGYSNLLGAGGATDTSELKAEVSPIAAMRKLKLQTLWRDKMQTDGAYRERGATVVLPPLPFGELQLTGGVRQNYSPGHEVLTGILDAEMTPLRYVQVTGAARLRDGAVNPDAPTPDTVNSYRLNMSLRPGAGLSLAGKLSRNPEQDDGTVAKSETGSIALETRLGALGLRGSVGFENQYVTARLLNTLDVGLDVHFTRLDMLTTGYQTRTTMDHGITAEFTYMLAFTHRLGQALNVSLGGSFTLPRTNDTTRWSDADVKAEAKVGLRF